MWTAEVFFMPAYCKNVDVVIAGIIHLTILNIVELFTKINCYSRIEIGGSFLLLIWKRLKRLG